MAFHHSEKREGFTLETDFPNGGRKEGAVCLSFKQFWAQEGGTEQPRGRSLGHLRDGGMEVQREQEAKAGGGDCSDEGGPGR